MKNNWTCTWSYHISYDKLDYMTWRNYSLLVFTDAAVPDSHPEPWSHTHIHTSSYEEPKENLENKEQTDSCDVTLIKRQRKKPLFNCIQARIAKAQTYKYVGKVYININIHKYNEKCYYRRFSDF